MASNLISTDSRTEGDEVVSVGVAFASKGAGGVIVGVTVRIGTSSLEDGGVVHGPMDRFARFGSVVGTAAAVLIRIESQAGALAGHGPP